MLAALTTVVVAGCGFDPQFPEGKISCRTEKDCPPSNVCLESLCYSRTAVAQDSGLGGSAMPNATGGAGATGQAGDGSGESGATAGTTGTGGDTGTGGTGAAGTTANVDAMDAPLTDGGIPDASKPDSSSGDGACTDACTLGAHHCGPTGLQTCVKAGACAVWSLDVACMGRKTCQPAGQGGGNDAQCACAPAPVGCEGGAGADCTAGKLRTCASDADGCVFEKSLDACTAGKPCAGTFPNAACTCPASPAICAGKSGTVCESNLSVATCGPNADGCLDVTKHTPCADAKPCAGALPAATCSCTSAPAACGGQSGMFCQADGKLATCDLDTNGCLAITNAVACNAGLTCQGAAPGASCKCPAPPAACAGGIGTACNGTTQVVTCGRDANGCLVISATASCAAGKPCAGTLPTAACTCPTPPAVCSGGTGMLCSAGQLDTCGVDANGCTVLSSMTTCPAGKPCGGSFPSASCMCPATPAGCGSGVGASCSGTSVVTCTLDVNGCYQAATGTCPGGKPCGGAFPSSACTCPASPAGCSSGVGTMCSGNSAVACSKDGNGCFQAATTTCTGQYCVGAFPSAMCAPPQSLGESTDLGSASSKSTGFLSGQPITVTATSTLRSFGLISRAAGTNVSFGLYTDVGGNPSTLVASAQYGALVVVGRTELAATAAVAGGLTLGPGTYWLMAMYDNTTSVAAAAAGGTLTNRRVIAAGWGDLPTTLSGVTAQNNVVATNYYVLVTTP